ncbi:MAG: hypothetical protein E5Y67_07175 [Mesorhizobium sp.]|uniref:hypothetical protein n=1 Tax=Mesorhizobium sp. TaxID=1871066 RepID=UPI00120E3DD3|nr:hypothetical protein [Mesorhizobium sp.]TIM15516.1 MAG: hypothetical protein E5Y67_07175 [Mesorhizobium sp.]
MRRLRALVVVTVSAAATSVGAAYGQEICPKDDVSELRDKHVVMLRKDKDGATEDFVNGVVVSQKDGLVLTVTSLLYTFDRDLAPETQIWNKFRSLKPPKPLFVSAGPDRESRKFESTGQIIGFDGWRDLLLVKVDPAELEGMEAVTLSTDASIEASDLCYASFAHQKPDSGGELKLLDENGDFGYWRKLQVKEVKTEERGSGIFVRSNPGSWSLYGILSTAHAEEESPGVLTVLYADALLAHLLYSPMQEICRIRLEQLRWGYSIERAEKLGALSNKSELSVKIFHNGLRKGTKIKRASAKWKIFGWMKGQDRSQDSTPVGMGGQDQKPLSESDIANRANEIDFKDSLSLVKEQGFDSIERIELHMFSTLELPGCRDSVHEDKITVYLSDRDRS